MSLKLVETLDDVHELLRWLGERRDWLGVDVETGGLDWWSDALRTVQVGDAMTGWTVPFQDWGGVIKQALSSYDGPWVAFNSKFEMHFLEHNGVGIRREWMHDAQIMAHLIDPLRSMALKNIAAREIHPAAASGEKLLKSAFAKNKWTWATVPIDYPAYWQYGALDTVLTARLARKYWPTIATEYRSVYEMEIAVLRALTDMERRGVMLNWDYIVPAREKLGVYVEQLKAWITAEFDIANPNSDAQVIQYFGAAGHVFTKLTDKGKIALDAEVLNSINHPAAKAVKDLRDNSRILGTYLDSYVRLADGDYLHGSINTTGAKTGRMSVSRPSLQNIPRSYHPRGAFKASPGRRLALFDYDQIEMRILAHFANEPSMLEAIRYGDAMTDAGYEGYDVHSMNARSIFNLPLDGVVPKDQRSITKNAGFACVPLDAEILTRSGWKSHSEVQVGDLTMTHEGWQPVLEVVKYDDAPLVKISNRHWEAVTTPNHRWLSRRRTGRGHTRREVEEYVTTETITTSHGVIISPEKGLPDSCDFSLTEAAVMGWLLCDGHIRWSECESGATSQSGGTKRGVRGTIYQSKPEFVEVIDTLLAGLPHHRSVRRGSAVVWELRASWLRPLLRRVGDDLEVWVMSLDRPALEAFVTACLHAEGDAQGYFVQNLGPVMDAFRLAHFLLGGHAAQSMSMKESYTGTECASVATRRRGVVTGQRVQVNDHGHGAVWCVRTSASTWTMRQGHRIMLTGNTVYGAGIERFALTAGVSVGEADRFMRQYHATNPGVKVFMNTVTTLAHQRARGGDKPWVVAPSGRKHRVFGTNELYKLVNHLIQGTAADVLKKTIVNLDMAGLLEWCVLPVHDELIFDVPEEHITELSHDVKKVMTVNDEFAVPLTVDGEVVDVWGDKYL